MDDAKRIKWMDLVDRHRVLCYTISDNPVPKLVGVQGVHTNPQVIQIGSLSEFEMQQQNTSRRRIESKAAVDVTIIITAFVLCYLPGFIEGLFRRSVQNIRELKQRRREGNENVS